MFRYSRREVKSWAKSRIPLIWRKRYTIAAAAAALILLYLFSSFVKMILVMAVFILLGVVSLIYNRWIKTSLGVELIMLGVVISSVEYGFFPGVVVGFVALFFAEIITDRFTYSTFVSFIGIAAVSLAAPWIDAGITWTGIFMTILYDAVIAPGYLIMGSSPWRTLVFVTTHVLFNAWVFFFIAPFALELVRSLPG